MSLNNCGCCCTNTLNLCEQNVCEGIDFGVSAQIPGVHRMVFEILGMMVSLEQEFSVDDQIIFSSDKLNENLEYTVELYDPLGQKILIRKGGVDYDCFRFRSVIGVTYSNVVIGS